MPLDDLIFQHKKFKIILPKQLNSIFEKIKGSENLLTNSSSNILSYKTWEKALKFLAEYSKYTYERYQVIIGVPVILEGEEDSIDLFFKTKSKNIMRINILNEKDKITASYFGQEYGGKNEIKEIIQIDKNKTKIHEPLAKWMKNYLVD